MSKRIKLTDSELANLNNQLIRARMGRMRSIVLNEPPSIDGGGGSDDAGGGTEEVPVSQFSIVAYNHQLANRWVDLYFDRGVYKAGGGAILAANLSLLFTSGGASNLVIEGVKKPDHHVFATATALSGGESVVRVFLTVTGTADSSESYIITPVDIVDADGNVLDGTTGSISLNVSPYNLWDAEFTSYVTNTGLGISTLSDARGNTNIVQATDADRPLHYQQAVAQFDRANTENLASSGTNATYEIQNATDFAILVKNLKPNMGTDLGYIISYQSNTTNHGWAFRVGHTNSGLNVLLFDNSAAKNALFNYFEDQERSFIVVNSGGTLTIYDENNNVVGTTSSTAVGTITYTSVTNLFVGRRQGVGTNNLNGEWAKLAYFNQALTSAQRIDLFTNINKQKIYQNGTITKYLFPVCALSTDPDAGDTMQLFLGDVLVRDGVQHLFYVGNSADGDIDTGFKATRTDDNSNTQFTKLLEAGLPKVILAPSGVDATFDENEIYIRTVIWNDETDEAYMYYTGRQTGATPGFTIGLATSTDLETFTKQGQIFTDGSADIILFQVLKRGVGDWIAVYTTSAAGGYSNYSYFWASSADGITWTKEGSIDSLFRGVILLFKLLIIQEELYVVATANNRDSAVDMGDDYVLYKVADDFTSSVYCGVIMTKTEPTERAIGGMTFVQRTNSIEVFYTANRNQNKYAPNGGEPFTSIRRAIIDKPFIQQPTQAVEYPSWVKKYWPLNIESAIANTFYEYIDGQTTTFAGTKQWSIDGLNFFDFLGTGFSWPAIDISSYADSLALKMRVEIVTSGTINLFSIGTDIVVQLVNGNLRVALNNATKDYITNDDIAMPVGITDVGNHVYVGFIWHGGVLKLCVGNTIDIASTKTVDNAMTDILNGGSSVLLCAGSTIEARSFVLMSGQTDQQWIDLDL